MNSSTSLVTISSAVLGDIAAAFGIPTGTATQLIRDYLNRKTQEARDILLGELSQARIDELTVSSKDEAIAVIYRYGMAVRDGAAKRNLRLLAKVVVGLAQRNCFFTDEFNKFADILSRLSRDEILVVGTLHRHRKNEERRHGPQISTHQWWPKAIDELVPSQFPSEEYVVAICCSALRTGLILTPKDFDSSGEYATSPIMDEVAELADFLEVLRQER